VTQWTKTLANEWAPKGINVNAIAPGYMATDNSSALRADPVCRRQILDRIPAPASGALPKTWLESPFFWRPQPGTTCTARVLVVDGGWMAR